MIYLVKIFYNNVLSNKKIFTLIAIVFLLLLSILLTNYYRYLYQEEIINNIDNRRLIARIKNDLDYYKDFISRMDNVNSVFFEIPYISVNILNNNFQLNYLDDDELHVVYGKGPNELLSNEIIVSNNYFNYDDLGKKYSVNILDKNYIYIIAGIYKNDNHKCIYTSLENIDFLLKDNNIQRYNENLIIIVNDYYETLNIIKALNEKNIEVSFYDSSGLENINNYKKIISFLCCAIYGILIIAFIIFYLILKNIIETENKDIVYMRVCGYRIRNILNIIFLRNTILIFTACLICFLINIILIMIIFVFFNSSMLCYFFKNNIFVLFKNFVLILMVLFVYNLFICLSIKKQIRKISIINSLK